MAWFMSDGPSSIEQKNAARMLFVQAVYGEHFDVPIESAESWVKRYHEDLLADGANPELEEDENSEEIFQLKSEVLPDNQFLRKLLRGWLTEKVAVENLLAAQLDNDEKRSFEHLSPLIQALLCAASFELVHLNTKKPVVLKEYIDIASGFFDNPELGFVNGTLQEVANAASAE